MQAVACIDILEPYSFINIIFKQFKKLNMKSTYSQFRFSVLLKNLLSPFKTVILTICLSFVTFKAFSQEPYVAGCFDVQRYLARGADAEALFDDSQSNITSAANALSAIDASFVFRCFMSWGFQNRFIPGFGYDTQIQATKAAIYNAYGSKRKPILQAGIFEYVSPSSNESIEQVTIPSDIISRFSNRITTNRNRYFDSNNNPRTDVKYIHNNVVRGTLPPYNNHPDYLNCPTLDKIEGFMWIFHQAKFYIDNGVNALHLGQIFWIAGLDYNPSNTYLMVRFANN